MDIATYHRRRSEIAGLPWRPYEPPRSHHAVLCERRFHYLEWGEEGRPCFVFLHGGSQNAWTWDTVCQNLASDHHCFALDLRGHGDSEWSSDRDYSLQGFVEDLAAFLTLVPPMPVLVGMSLGGLTSIAYAIRSSQDLSGLVCVDVGPDVNVEAAQPIRDFVKVGFSLSQFDEFVEAASKFNKRRHKELLAFSMRRNLRRLANGDLTWKTDPQMREAVDDVVKQTPQIQKTIGAISCPVLVARGEHSEILSEEQAAAFAGAVPNGQWLTIPNAGHSIQGDNPKDLIAALRRFQEGESGLRQDC